MEEAAFDLSTETESDRYSITYRNIYRNFRRSSIEVINSSGARQSSGQTFSGNSYTFGRISSLTLQSLDREDCLENLLQEIRQALQTDRLVVYRFDRDWSGTIVAESVVDGLPTSLDCHINDPCFRESYAQLYSEGRMRAIANIYTADLTDCHIKFLEQLAVKASLIVPITNDNQLLGLLIAHQCDAPRNWQIEEMELLKQLTTVVSSTLQYRILQQECQTAVEYARQLTQITQIVQQVQSSSDIFNAIVNQVRRAFQADRVLVKLVDRLETNGSGIVVAESVAPGLPQTLHHPIVCLYRSEGEMHPFSNREVRAIADINTAELPEFQVDTLLQFAVKANLVAPIVSDGKLVGSLIVHQCTAPRTWQTAEIDLLGQIAVQVGLALDRIALLEYRAAAAKQVQLRQQIALQLQRSHHQSEILTIATSELKSALQADRAIVYCLNGDRVGTVVAESVTPGLPQALNHRLDDSFWGKRSVYEQIGYVRAINNVYTAGLGDRGRQILERFAVKSNVIVPISIHGELFGLLIAHQCFCFREWQQTEIDFCTQVAMDIGFALEQAQLREKLAQIAQITMPYNRCVQTPVERSTSAESSTETSADEPHVNFPSFEDKEHDATVAF